MPKREKASKVVREVLVERESLEPYRESGLWEPEWSSEFHGWTVKFVQKNLWKVRPELDFDDLYQEFAFKFAYLCGAYPHVIEAKHFMALYKRACYTHLIDLAGANTLRKKEMPTSSIFTEDGEIMDVEGDPGLDHFRVELSEVLPKAPAPIRTIITETLEGRGAPASREDGTRETCNERLSRLAGLKDVQPLKPLLLSWASVALS